MSTQQRTGAKWGIWEGIALGWILAAFVGGVVATVLLQGTLPLFTFVWLIVPLIVLLMTKDAGRLGIRSVPGRELLLTTAVNVAVWWGLMLIFEPWTHVYRDLVREAVSGTTPDTTFGWLIRFPGAVGWIGIVLYSGLVTLFAEELFFHGWLLQLLLRRMKLWSAIVLEAVILSVPQLIVMLLFPALQGIVWIVIYSWLAVGVVGGWAAARTKSIWPSLIAATVTNLVLTAIVF